MTIPNRPSLADMMRLPLGEAASLPAEMLALLQEEAEQTVRLAKMQKDWLDGALTRRYANLATELRSREGKDSGTVRFDDGDITVVADLPKKVEWDQSLLTAIVERIRASGDEATAARAGQDGETFAMGDMGDLEKLWERCLRLVCRPLPTEFHAVAGDDHNAFMEAVCEGWRPEGVKGQANALDALRLDQRIAHTGEVIHLAQHDCRLLDVFRQRAFVLRRQEISSRIRHLDHIVRPAHVLALGVDAVEDALVSIGLILARIEGSPADGDGRNRHHREPGQHHLRLVAIEAECLRYRLDCKHPPAPAAYYRRRPVDHSSKPLVITRASNSQVGLDGRDGRQAVVVRRHSAQGYKSPCRFEAKAA